MSRYLDRPPPEARARFEASCESQGIEESCENNLIRQALRIVSRTPAFQYLIIANRFEEGHVPVVMDLLEEIRADFDRDAEAAGEPEGS